jgi:hypothetical protein
LYTGKHKTTYWYMCSQQNSLAKKPRKHIDSSKHRDMPSMERFDCNGVIKVSINQSTMMAEVDLQHEQLHAQPKDTSVPQNIKDFIKENIDLLPCEIYARLVADGMDLSIRQKQIHFWWSELGKYRYKCQEDAFESAIQWLKEKQYRIILEQRQPVHALAVLTGFYEALQEMEVDIYECGIDATCKQTFIITFLVD